MDVVMHVKAANDNAATSRTAAFSEPDWVLVVMVGTEGAGVGDDDAGRRFVTPPGVGVEVVVLLPGAVVKTVGVLPPVALEKEAEEVASFIQMAIGSSSSSEAELGKAGIGNVQGDEPLLSLLLASTAELAGVADSVPDGVSTCWTSSDDEEEPSTLLVDVRDDALLPLWVTAGSSCPLALPDDDPVNGMAVVGAGDSPPASSELTPWLELDDHELEALDDELKDPPVFSELAPSVGVGLGDSTSVERELEADGTCPAFDPEVAEDESSVPDTGDAVELL